jgi:hypothetical protein
MKRLQVRILSRWSKILRVAQWQSAMSCRRSGSLPCRRFPWSRCDDIAVLQRFDSFFPRSWGNASGGKSSVQGGIIQPHVTLFPAPQGYFSARCEGNRSYFSSTEGEMQVRVLRAALVPPWCNGNTLKRSLHRRICSLARFFKNAPCRSGAEEGGTRNRRRTPDGLLSARLNTRLPLLADVTQWQSPSLPN